MIRIRSIALLSALTISISPLLAHADVIINNYTNAPGTAYAGMSPCSSVAGDKGIIKAHSKMVVPQFVLDVYCSKSCKANVFMTKNCTGHKIATLTVDKTGITGISNDNVDGYVVSGGGKNVSVNGGPQRKWYEIFMF